MEYLRISWELLVTSMVFTYPTWTIIIPTLWIQSENVDIKIQVCDRHPNEHTALKRLGGDFTDRKKGKGVALFTGAYLKSLLLSTSENQA